MAREKRKWHPLFLKYMEEIIKDPHYEGLPIEKKRDGTYGWIVFSDYEIGRKRAEWCARKADELGIEKKPGFYAEVMREIHPTKWKVCQTCGEIMSIYYHYPNMNFLNAINREFHSDFTDCDYIYDIWDELVESGVDEEEVARFFIRKGKLDLDAKTASKSDIIETLEKLCRKGNKKLLGPGAMSNFPDRFDGFHTYNRCCRANQDTGRSKENLKSYSKDRRAYEYWSDGNIHAANKFMCSDYFDGTSADHIGPISLGFVHDPRYLQPMPSGDNSSKRDRLSVEDIEKIIEVEKRTGVYPMSWYSKLIWEYIRKNYRQHPELVATKYRDALKQNMSNFMFVLFTILDRCGEKGKAFLKKAFLEPKYDCFNYSYCFNERGEIVSKTPRRFTGRMNDEEKRYHRTAIDAAYDYQEKDNRNNNYYLVPSEQQLLLKICDKISAGTTPTRECKYSVERLMEFIQRRVIEGMGENY